MLVGKQKINIRYIYYAGLKRDKILRHATI